MAYDINQFKAQLAYDGARPTAFEVTFTNPVDSSAVLKIPFMVRATSIPSAELGVIPAYYFGREIKLAGDRTFQDWEVTVINDEDFLIRNALEGWSNAVNALESNIRQFATSASTNYKSAGQVQQFSKVGVPIRTYQFQGIWPRIVSDIPLDWNTQNTLEEFRCTFLVDYWVPVSPSTTGTVGSV